MEYTFKNFFFSAPLTISIISLLVIIFITVILPKLKNQDKNQYIIDNYIKKSVEDLMPEIMKKLETLFDELAKFDLDDFERFKMGVEKDLFDINNNVRQLNQTILKWDKFLNHCLSIIEKSNLSETEKINLLAEIKNLKELIDKLSTQK